MAYTAWNVVFGEQPTAAKWNQLGQNDAGFKDGTNIDDDAIINRHLANNSVTSPNIDFTTLPQSSNYIRFGNLLICFASLTASTTGTTFSFPQPFASNPFMVTDVVAPDAGTYASFVRTLTPTGAAIKSTSASAITVQYIAIGTAA